MRTLTGVLLSATLVLSTTASLSAQTVVVGSQRRVPGHFTSNDVPPYTVVDVAHPATAAGTVASVSVRWVFRACKGAFKVKFLHPADPTSLTTYTLVAERGPFDVLPGMNQFAIDPAVPLAEGDLLALTPLRSFGVCGTPSASGDPASAILEIPGDPASGTFPHGGTWFRGLSLDARATDTKDVFEGVIAAAGSLQGNFGSSFRTSLQIANNADGGVATGRLVFHPAGAPASPSDPVLPYTLPRGSAVSYDDVVQTLGASGLGTIDVISTNGFPPVVTGRIYNDAGAHGTSGFTEEMIAPAGALHVGEAAILLMPADVKNYRVNIGIRTLAAGASVNLQFGARNFAMKEFPANTFQQVSLAELDPGSGVFPNEQLEVTVIRGDAIIYASTTDNRTNDSSVQFARREP
ncbi:MAG: hypothetical protein JWO56_3536 [Acidobacteria bacterium]|nr:hypothetical protein [Acidobacteriota bacterium]